ncbi:hypothetical protein QTL86_13340 [Cellulosilyticum sp. ST5]|uniref:hypothetical protein n=1 Tax=Cellulosilyticum sp. ST5 TaxID=3055805 RepID=UPI0039773CEA
MNSETFAKEMLEMVEQVETSNLPMFFDYLIENIRDNNSFEAHETALNFVVAFKDVVMKQREEALN